MYLKIHNKKIKIEEYTGFFKRFKSLKFVLETINYGIVLPKRKLVNTYWFCQSVDCVICDKNNIIIKMYEDLPSEKLRFKFRGYYVYFLPLNTIKYLKVGEELKIKDE